jgi:hypothetical protein
MTKQLLFNLPLLFLITDEVAEFEGIMTTDEASAFNKNQHGQVVLSW